MRKTKISFFILLFTFCISNSLLGMHPSAQQIRKHFEKGTQKKLTKNTLIRDVVNQHIESYREENKKDLTQLQLKKRNAKQVARQKVFWGSVDTVLGSVFIGLGAWAIRNSFRETSSNSTIAGWKGLIWGTLCIVPGSYVALNGVRSILKNSNPEQIRTRIAKQVQANLQAKAWIG